MISGYFRHVVIARIPYKRFQYICTSILPEIGSNITSLVVSNQWKGILSKLFSSYFGDRMPLIFPHLQQITLISFSDYSLISFLDSLENLPEFHEMILCHQYQMVTNTVESEKLLHKLFTVNNNRLNSIIFDDDSMVFSFTNKVHDIIYSNIQKLSIDLQTINDLHRLLTFLPQLQSINVAINKDTIESDIINENTPIVTLKQFQLQSFGPSWNLDDLASILKRIPNVEELSIAIEVNDDIRLIDGAEVYPLISTLTLRKFNYFLRFYDSSSSIDHVKILSSWQQFNQEFVCIKSDDKNALVLYTLPFVFSFLILPSSIANNGVFIKNYASQVKIFTLCSTSTNIVDTLSVIQKCQKLENLILRNVRNTNIPSRTFFVVACSRESFFYSFIESFKEIGFCRLAYLTKLTALRDSSINADFFQRLLEISPNLYHLEINYESLLSCFDNESICILLKHRITHIYLLITGITIIESVVSSISRLPSIFPSLKHIYFCFETISSSCELLISTVLKYLSEWNSLVSFGVVGTGLTQAIVLKDPQQWVLDNSTLNEQNTFTVDFTDDAFRLWL